MQKLLTILLHDNSRDQSRHGEVEEHLREYLIDGWRVVSMASVGHTGGQSRGTRAWLAVVLEKS
jgi:hypothetical protein